MHQVLCTRSNDATDTNGVCCSVCGQGFIVFWSRFSRKEQDECRQLIHETLRGHHAVSPNSAAGSVHPDGGFNVPEWSGHPDFSAAAILTDSKPGSMPLSVSGMFNVKHLDKSA